MGVCREARSMVVVIHDDETDTIQLQVSCIRIRDLDRRSTAVWGIYGQDYRYVVG
jgi:hypothetical protein